MIKYDYDTPLTIANKNDEIGELAGNFEAMRQKVKILTTTDSLTGLLNRGFFMINLEKEFSRIKRSEGNLACLMIDIDDFKELNDKYGHQFGDEVLKKFAVVMTEVARDYDMLARYGGEEFIVALPDTDIEDARLFAERLRVKTSVTKINFNTQVACITVSIGVSQIEDMITDSSELLINRADKALYRAKHAVKTRLSSMRVSLKKYDL